MGREENGCRYLILLHINGLFIFRLNELRLVFQVQYKTDSVDSIGGIMLFFVSLFYFIFYFIFLLKNVDYGEALIMEVNGTHFCLYNLYNFKMFL